jgi:hypothetical protein
MDSETRTCTRCKRSMPLKVFVGNLCERCQKAMQPDRVRLREEHAARPQSAATQAIFKMIARHREQRAEEREERDATRWLLAIDVREQRRAMAAQQAIFDAEDADPALQSTRRIWQAIVNPSRFVRRGKTARQIERETHRRAQAAINLTMNDPMRWKA